MDERDDWLAERFEENRPHLRAVAYRILGSPSEADDALQETWLRLSRSDTSDLLNLRGWLTTVIGRVCLDMLRSRRSRREVPLNEPKGPARVPHSIVSHLEEEGTDPEHEALVADSVGPALLVVLETLSPAERIAFVLHDMFGVSFEEISPIVGRSQNAAKMLASRARRRVRGVAQPVSEADPGRQREAVEAFLAAAREGDFDKLLAVLDPDVVLMADRGAERVGLPREVRGAPAVADTFSGRARAARPALVDGAIGVAVAPRGRLLMVLGFTTSGGKIVEIEVIADPERVGQLDLRVLDD